MKRYAARRGTRGVIKQAGSDVARGLVDTDRRGAAVKLMKKKKG